MFEINAATAATPGAVVAMALITHGRRGVAHSELLGRVRRLVAVLHLLGARMTPSLATSAGAVRPTCVTEAVQMYRDAGLLEVHVPGENMLGDAKPDAAPSESDEPIYQVPEDKRLALDLSKNIILHYFVPSALVSAAVLVPPGPTIISRSVVRERVQRLSRLFKYEFMFRADATFEQIFDVTLQQMLSRGELVVEASDHLGLGEGHDGLDGRGWVVLYASMLRNFLEGYRVAARSLSLLLKGPMTLKELGRRTLAMGDRMYLAGEIERRESLSRPCLDNAFLSLLDQGYLRRDNDKKVALASSFDDAAAVRAIESRIANYLHRRADDRG
jgi:glycerol-3-phosphate O-acyltransferase